jgi:hypothetical protein
MREFFTIQAIIMFLIGVFTSAMVKGFLSRAKSKVAGA